MAFTAVGAYGTGQVKTAGAVVELFQPNLTLAVGNLLVVTIANDNTQTTDGASTSVTSVVGSHSGTFTKAAEITNGAGAAAAGVACSIWYKRITTAVNPFDDTITITCAAGVVAKAAGCYIFNSDQAQISVAQVLTSVNDTDPGTMTISGLTSRSYLFIRADATERGNYGYLTSTNYTAFMQNTTNEPGDATDVSIGAEYRIFTGTGDTTDPVTGTPESASVYVAFTDASAALNVPVTGVSGTGAVGTATSKVNVRPAVTGVAGTGAVGTTTQSAKASATVSGVAATGAIGTATSKVNAATTLTGVQATALLGAAAGSAQTTAAASVPAVSMGLGSVTISGRANVTLTGLQATSGMGVATHAQPNQVVLPSLGATTSLGVVVAAGGAGHVLSGMQAQGLLGAVQAFIGTVIPVTGVQATATLSNAMGYIGQTNTRVFLQDLNLPGMSMPLGEVGVRAWGLVDDSARTVWTDIYTE